MKLYTGQIHVASLGLNVTGLRRVLLLLAAIVTAALFAPLAAAQPPAKPRYDLPGDQMMRDYLAHETAKVESRLAEDFSSQKAWDEKRAQYAGEYLYMLGLSPLPERTPLHPVITRSIARDDYVVDMIHYQSRPGLYVTGNLYRPARLKPGERLPAVLYVCGHANRGRDGNKTAYQSHGIWFARHGYLCLTLDTLQLGEIAAFHHGTYKLGRWWWHSRGYTPAGVEAWNGIRGIDYLASRPDVDPQRIAVTGISGGGAATLWIAAADERVKVAVPVSGMADLQGYVADRVIDRHCDCMLLYNSRQWPWARIAALIAPRPLLFVNSDEDELFPTSSNERIANRLEQTYSLFGAGDQFDAVTSVGGHDYRQDIRQAAYRFINAHLKDDPRPVLDSETDVGTKDPASWPFRGEDLRVFPTDADLPADELNTTIDERFVPLATPALPAASEFDAWRTRLLAELRTHCFSYFPETIPPATKLEEVDRRTERMRSEEHIEFRLRRPERSPAGSKNVLLVVLNQDEAGAEPEWVHAVAQPDESVLYCEPRGIGATRWTTENPPNRIERSHALLGRTIDAGRVWDVIAAAKYLANEPPVDVDSPKRHIRVAGRAAAAAIAAYAAALCDGIDDEIDAVAIVSPTLTHMDAAAPQFLNVLRICDVPHVLGLIAPRPLRVLHADENQLAPTIQAYAAASASNNLTQK